LQEIQGQRSFAVILSGRMGRERFRHTIRANDQGHATEKATRMAKRMQVEVESVAPEHPTLIAWSDADAAPERGDQTGRTRARRHLSRVRLSGQ
jgi:hypothetical protein